MKLKVFFVADPVESLNPKSDTSLSILRAVLEKGHEAFWVDHQAIGLSGTKLFFEGAKCLPFKKGELPHLKRKSVFSAKSFHVGLIRKDPPFNEDYLKLCWLLSLLEPRVFFINKPSLLLRYHEKLLPLEAFNQGFLKKEDLIPTFFGAQTEAKLFLKGLKQTQVVTKPFLGHGGRGIKLQSKKKFRDSLKKPCPHLVQPYLEEVSQEDRRVLIIGGKVAGQFVRVPPPGGFIANLAQGGTPLHKPLSKSQKLVVERSCQFLKKKGFSLAGLDLIGDKISEINVTSPTGFLSVEDLTGKNPAQDILKLIERSVLRDRK